VFVEEKAVRVGNYEKCQNNTLKYFKKTGINIPRSSLPLFLLRRKILSCQFVLIFLNI